MDLPALLIPGIVTIIVATLGVIQALKGQKNTARADVAANAVNQDRLKLDSMEAVNAGLQHINDNLQAALNRELERAERADERAIRMETSAAQQEHAARLARAEIHRLEQALLALRTTVLNEVMQEAAKDAVDGAQDVLEKIEGLTHEESE